jgi:branched-subunit amino acid transport protein AzlD
MPDHRYLLAGVLVAAAITWALRATPFLMLVRLRDSAFLAHLGTRMPVGIMVILAVYTLRDVDPASTASAVPAAAALAVTVGLHLWRRNATLSIFAGTAVSVVLASTLSALT